MKYRVHRFTISMTRDEHELEDFLNRLEGDVISIIPNVTWAPKVQVDFLLIIEGLPESSEGSETNLQEKISFG